LSSEPTISVIILTHNSESDIHRCLSSIITQSFPRNNFEIIIVDDGSKDNTISIVKKLDVDKIVQTEPCSIGKARNIGVQNSRGNLIAFIDSDCAAQKKWLEVIVKELEKINVIGGPILNGNTKSFVACAEYLMEFSEFSENQKRKVINFAPCCNLAFRKKAFEQTEGFSEEQKSEDVLFGNSLREAGVTTVFVPEMQISHYCRTRLDKYLSNSKTLGRYAFKTGKDVPTIWSKLTKSKWYIPIVFVVKIGARARRAVWAKKFSKFCLAFPLIVLGTISFCEGILQEKKWENKIH